nr:MAG TPA: Sigma 54 modulation/S30EA ribosomal protein C terminus [Caudoviricetes sp.]
MKRSFLIHLNDGTTKIIRESEAIENALKQEEEGIEPHYSFFDYKTREAVTAPGWLIWSTLADGCGVVYRRSDGKMIVSTGFQGDFCYI